MLRLAFFLAFAVLCDAAVYGSNSSQAIKIGYTIALTGLQQQYSVPQSQYYEMIFNYVNNDLGGIDINGTNYFIQWHVYDDASDCENLAIFYDRLINVDKVHILLSGESGHCTEMVNTVENNSKIPLINTGDFNYEFEFPAGLNLTKWVLNTVPPILKFLDPCISAFYSAGARTVGIVYTEGYGPAMVAATMYSIATIAPQMTIIFNDSLMQAKIDDNSTYINYLDPYITNWTKSRPDLFFASFGVSGYANALQAMNLRQFNPAGRMYYAGTTTDYLRTQTSWQSYGASAPAWWDAIFDFSDPLIGNTSNFRQLFAKNFGGTPSAVAAGFTVGAVIAINTIRQTQSLDPIILRRALFNLNLTTFFGPTIADPNTGYVSSFREYCFQVGPDGSYTVVNDPTFPGPNGPLIWPYNLVYPDYFLSILFPPSHRTQKILEIVIPTGVGILILIAIAGVIFYLIKYHWYIVWFKRDEVENPDKSLEDF